MNFRFCYALMLAVLMLTAPLSVGHAESSSNSDDLVAAIDAAWVRVLDKDIFRNIVARHGLQDVVVNISDCLPNPSVTHFPEAPSGRLKKILDAERIRVGVTAAGTLDEGATATRFVELSPELLGAVLAELSAQYDTGPIEIEYHTIQPPFPITSTLNSGVIDVVGLVNALGGKTEGLRRRDSRRFTCTMTATRQILWLKKDGGPDWNHVNDAFDDPEIKMCVGPLSNQLTKAYFDGPGQQVKTEYVSDLDICLRRLINGDIDAMVSPFTHEKFFPEKVDTNGDGERDTATAGLFRSINTNIVAGTPIWVPMD
jgi:ABC-type amino acid transport substrate-binding protein